MTELMDSLPDPSLAALHAYWNDKRAGAAAPLRSAIAPADIAPLLGDMFILDGTAPGTAPFRLAGTRVCAAFGRELRDSDLLGLLGKQDRAAMAELLRTVTDEAAAFALALTATNVRGHSVPAALILLPMSQDGRCRAGPSPRLGDDYSQFIHHDVAARAQLAAEPHVSAISGERRHRHRSRPINN
jgi:hypothetical protein